MWKVACETDLPPRFIFSGTHNRWDGPGASKGPELPGPPLRIQGSRHLSHHLPSRHISGKLILKRKCEDLKWPFWILMLGAGISNSGLNSCATSQIHLLWKLRGLKGSEPCFHDLKLVGANWIRNSGGASVADKHCLWYEWSGIVWSYYLNSIKCHPLTLAA